MRLAPEEPQCLVVGLTHAWVPVRERPPLHVDETDRARCGRCQLTRVRHPSGRTTYWEPPRSPSHALD